MIAAVGWVLLCAEDSPTKGDLECRSLVWRDRAQIQARPLSKNFRIEPIGVLILLRMTVPETEP
jgi:hypothetical protein